MLEAVLASAWVEILMSACGTRTFRKFKTMECDRRVFFPLFLFVCLFMWLLWSKGNIIGYHSFAKWQLLFLNTVAYFVTKNTHCDAISEHSVVQSFKWEAQQLPAVNPHKSTGRCRTTKDVQGGCLKWELSDMHYLGMLPNADKGFAVRL